MPLILGTNSIKDTGFNVANSCRFDRGSTDFLNKTLGTPTNVDKATFSTWIKFTDTSSGNDATLFGVLADGNNTTYIQLLGSKVIRLNMRESTSYIGVLTTNRVFRDPSAWYHIVVAFDTTQGTDSNRIKLYIDGVQETSFSTATYPSQNTDLRFNTSGQVFNIGRRGDSVNLLDGYLAETVFIDGQQLAPDQFGEFDEDSPTIWKPKDVSGLTFGNNGFYLDYKDSGNLGNDVNGGTDLTVNNLTAIDQSTDTCTNNFATLNPIETYPETDLSEGNLKSTRGPSTYRSAFSTIAITTGKWYAEFKIEKGNNSAIGVVNIDKSPFGTYISGTEKFIGINDNAVALISNNLYFNNSTQGGTWTSWSDGDIIGIALDVTNGYVYFSVNGTFQNSGNPTSGSGGYALSNIGSNGTYLVGCSANQSFIEANFGSPSYTISSGNSDANGYGNFEYSVPSGYYALNTKNLSEYG